MKENDKRKARPQKTDERKTLAESAAVLAEVKDWFDGFVSEYGIGEMLRYSMSGGVLYRERLPRAASAIKRLAAAARKPIVWELLICTPLSGEPPVRLLCRTHARAKELMEEDIRETLACRSAQFAPAELVRTDADNAHYANAIRWSISRMDIVD